MAGGFLGSLVRVNQERKNYVPIFAVKGVLRLTYFQKKKKVLKVQNQELANHDGIL